jgi:hypothetical protein
VRMGMAGPLPPRAVSLTAIRARHQLAR